MVTLDPVTYSDLMESVKKNKPTVSKEQLKQYEEFTSKFGQEG